jgi:hypothetical protein
MRLLVSGDRYWKWEERLIILEEIKKMNPSVIIHGGAKGVDTIAGKVGIYLGIEVIVFPAEWHIYGKAAGAIRNLQMIEEGKPDFILAFHKNINDSKGTKHMINQAVNHKIPYKLIDKQLSKEVKNETSSI